MSIPKHKGQKDKYSSYNLTSLLRYWETYVSQNESTPGLQELKLCKSGDASGAQRSQHGNTLIRASTSYIEGYGL